ncbi:hypothetical protein AAA414_04060 [Lactobacillus crispatus]|uniref:hypothetical protein n=1 Tax=Lactobacillus crispatus TaxID=47770 RepID=UPI0030F8E60D
MLEDFDYQEQQMIVNAHMSLEDYENTDYYRLVEVMSARPKDKRPMSLWDFAASLDKTESHVVISQMKGDDICSF